MRITRSTLKKLIEQTLKETRGLGRRQVEGLRTVGDTADTILLGKWYDFADPSCGCVVGSYLGGQAPDFKSPLYRFGTSFDDRLRAHLATTQFYGSVQIVNR